jgi:hypothetical protein
MQSPNPSVPGGETLFNHLAVSQLLWSDKDREVWFSWEENPEVAYRFALDPLRNCSSTGGRATISEEL